MKALVLTGIKQFEIQELDTPEIQPNEVLINTAYAGVCGTDHDLYAGRPGSAPAVPPIILGHVMVGAEVDALVIGAKAKRGNTRPPPFAVDLQAAPLIAMLEKQVELYLVEIVRIDELDAKAQIAGIIGTQARQVAGRWAVAQIARATPGDVGPMSTRLPPIAGVITSDQDVVGIIRQRMQNLIAKQVPVVEYLAAIAAVRVGRIQHRG